MCLLPQAAAPLPQDGPNWRAHWARTIKRDVAARADALAAAAAAAARPSHAASSRRSKL